MVDNGRKEIYTPLANYYGHVVLWDNTETDGKYYISLDNYSSTMDMPISKELYDMLLKELGSISYGRNVNNADKEDEE